MPDESHGSKRVKRATKDITEEERAAVREWAREARERSKLEKGDPEAAVLAKISEMKPSDRAMAERIHAIVKSNAPDLVPRTWYGMPAYSRDGNVVCFFQPAEKFKTRYATLGFSDEANLDEGSMWPSAFALTDLNSKEEARIAALVKKAVSPASQS